MKKEYLLLLVLLPLAYVYYAQNRTRPEAGLTPAEHGLMMALGIRQMVLPANNSETISIRFKNKTQ